MQAVTRILAVLLLGIVLGAVGTGTYMRRRDASDYEKWPQFIETHERRSQERIVGYQESLDSAPSRDVSKRIASQIELEELITKSKEASHTKLPMLASFVPLLTFLIGTASPALLRALLGRNLRAPK